jgi:hypothetical protein
MAAAAVCGADGKKTLSLPCCPPGVTFRHQRSVILRGVCFFDLSTLAIVENFGIFVPPFVSGILPYRDLEVFVIF